MSEEQKPLPKPGDALSYLINRLVRPTSADAASNTQRSIESLRDEFEKLVEIPERLYFNEEKGLYMPIDSGNVSRLLSYQVKYSNCLYQGFLLGRRNTVSVEKYRDDVEAAYMEGHKHCASQSATPTYTAGKTYEWSQAKRRTEEV